MSSLELLASVGIIRNKNQHALQSSMRPTGQWAVILLTGFILENTEIMKSDILGVFAESIVDDDINKKDGIRDTQGKSYDNI